MSPEFVESLAKSYLPCFHHRRYIRYFEQVVKSTSKMWDAAKMIDTYFLD